MRCVTLALAVSATAFAPGRPLAAAPARPARRASSALRMGFFDGLAGAFANQEFDEAPKGGVTKKPTVEVVVMGKKAIALPGQRLKDVVRAARAPVRFNCEDGKCGTCESKVNGRLTRVCVAKVPAKGPVRVERR
mmetsp:Transcript_21452/g.64154  ORF Transcript_21452/g.64154 Transcript_21452/m.64154 type:complete len:135 (+) Transcript_21452:215-619(+)